MTNAFGTPSVGLVVTGNPIAAGKVLDCRDDGHGSGTAGTQAQEG